MQKLRNHSQWWLELKSHGRPAVRSPRDLGVRVGFYGVRIQFGGQGGIRNSDLLSDNFHLDLTTIDKLNNILWKFLLGVPMTVEVTIATVSLAALLYTEGGGGEKCAGNHEPTHLLANVYPPLLSVEYEQHAQHSLSQLGINHWN